MTPEEESDELDLYPQDKGGEVCHPQIYRGMAGALVWLLQADGSPDTAYGKPTQFVDVEFETPQQQIAAYQKVASFLQLEQQRGNPGFTISCESIRRNGSHMRITSNNIGSRGESASIVCFLAAVPVGNSYTSGITSLETEWVEKRERQQIAQVLTVGIPVSVHL